MKTISKIEVYNPHYFDILQSGEKPRKLFTIIAPKTFFSSEMLLNHTLVICTKFDVEPVDPVFVRMRPFESFILIIFLDKHGNPLRSHQLRKKSEYRDETGLLFQWREHKYRQIKISY